MIGVLLDTSTLALRPSPAHRKNSLFAAGGLAPDMTVEDPTYLVRQTLHCLAPGQAGRKGQAALGVPLSEDEPKTAWTTGATTGVFSKKSFGNDSRMILPQAEPTCLGSGPLT